MATPENAFSVFSMQRREGARAIDVVPDAYHTENALFMTQGNFYLEIHWHRRIPGSATGHELAGQRFRRIARRR
jgi:hypothetical protein